MDENKIYCGLILLITLSSLFGQNKIHKSITTADGLLSGEIYSMTQDYEGAIWFATPVGISRWNGSSFYNFNSDNGLQSQLIFDIEEGNNHEIIISTFGKGATIYKKGKFTQLTREDGLSSNFIGVIYKSRNGNIYLCAEDRIYQYIDGKVFDFGAKIGLEIRGITSFLETSDSIKYVGTKNGLYVISEDKVEVFNTSDGLKSNEISGMDEDFEGKIHIGTKEGINIFYDQIFYPLKYKNKDIDYYIYEVLTASDGSIYYMSENGVIINTNGKVCLLSEKEGLIDNHVWSVLEDKNGSLYFGSSGFGVSIYNPDLIENYSNQNGLRNTNITNIAEDKFQNIIVGTNKGLYIKKTYKKNFNTIVQEFSDERIKNIIVSKENDIFFGTENYLCKLILTPNEEYKIQYKKKLGEIYSIIELNASTLSIGTQQGTIHLFKKDLSEEQINSPTKHNFIHARIITEDGTIISSIHGKGIVLEKDGQATVLKNSSIPSENQITSICEVSDGNIWLGTQQAGIKILKNKIFKDFEKNDELLSNVIYQILRDHNNIYISTPKGINIISISQSDTLIRSIVDTDGLINNSINKNALFVDSSGKLLIGTKTGLTVYNPQKNDKHAEIPKLFLTKFEIFNQEFDLEYLNAKPSLSYDQNYLTFYFDCIYLSNKNKIKYFFRLNLDRKWQKVQSNSIRFANLNSGDYKLEIKCRDEWHNWSNTIKSSFNIKSVWYSTWWFYTLLILVVVIIVTIIVSYRYRSLLAVEKIRTKIASDLHDEVGSLLTQISMTSEMISHRVEDIKLKEKTSFVREKCNEVIGIMSDVIWAIDSRNDNFQSLIDRIQHFATNFLTQKGIELFFNDEVENKYKIIKSDFRQNIFMIIKEAVNNAVKHAKCSCFEIKIEYSVNKFSLYLKDNGKGFDLKKTFKGNGIKNMKMRAKLINADIKFENNDGLSISLLKSDL